MLINDPKITQRTHTVTEKTGREERRPVGLGRGAAAVRSGAANIVNAPAESRAANIAQRRSVRTTAM